VSTAAELCRAALDQARERLARRGPVDVLLLRDAVGEAAAE